MPSELESHLLNAPTKRTSWLKRAGVLAAVGAAGALLYAGSSAPNGAPTELSFVFHGVRNWWYRNGRCSTYAECPCKDLLQGTPPSDTDQVPDDATYAAALSKLDMEAVKHDLDALMTASQDCWPADFGHYGPFFVRLAWHCSGTYRNSDGSGGCAGGRQRFEPERSWPDNTNLDKARALLWPIKQKYGDALSWGDLFALAGTQGLRSMGTPITKFCFGRIDDSNGTKSNVLGPTKEQQEKFPCKQQGKCEAPLGATTLGLIYVNPEGPIAQDADGKWANVPDPIGSSKEVRSTFGLMGASDVNTVALIGGGHAFGKSHGACNDGAGQLPKDAYPDGTPWAGACGSGRGDDTFTSGFEGQWTTTPTKWSNEYFQVLEDSEWEKWVGPGGHWQWRTVDRTSKYSNMIRLTSDLALLQDKKYRKIVHAFATNLTYLNEAFDAAWQQLMSNGGRWSEAKKCDHICVGADGKLGPCQETTSLADTAFEPQRKETIMLGSDF